MKLMLLLCCTLSALAQERTASLAGELDMVARAATIMLDGDLCRRIQTPRSLGYLSTQNLPDPWFASDNFDVNHGPYIQTKKLLIRLARLAKQPCDVNLWMPLPGDPPRAQVLIRNVLELSQFWKFGELMQPLAPEMKQVLQEGKRIEVRKRPGFVSVLAPVYDSLGDIVALVEVVGRLEPDPQEDVK